MGERTNLTAMAKLLVLLDMNGTLLYRAKSRLPKLVPDLAPSGVRKSALPGAKYFYYVRPQARWFVRALMAMPRVRLAFCTSMQGANARPAVEYLAGEGWNQAGVLLLDRRFQKPDAQGKNSWDTMRDMAKVWAHLANEQGPAAGLTNDRSAGPAWAHGARGLLLPQAAAAAVAAAVRSQPPLSPWRGPPPCCARWNPGSARGGRAGRLATTTTTTTTATTPRSTPPPCSGCWRRRWWIGIRWGAAL